MELTIVIICKNDATGLVRTIQSIAGLDADILVYDFGSTDASRETASMYGARFYDGKCENYERMRYHASRLARHDWILMLHPGEVVDTALNNALKEIDLNRIKQVYRIRFKNYFGNRWLRHGELGQYTHIRLANREGIETDGESVYEQLFHRNGVLISKMNGYILHRTVKNLNDLSEKIMHDAMLWALRAHRQGKKTGIIKPFFSPAFSFFKNYFFKLGFLDGSEGYVCAKMGAWYNFLKYARLRELSHTIKKKT